MRVPASPAGVPSSASERIAVLGAGRVLSGCGDRDHDERGGCEH